MRVPLLFGVLMTVALVGCNKRTAKKPSADDSASVTPTPAPAVTNDKDKKKDAKEDDAPNWLNDPRFAPEKPEGRVEPKGLSAKLPWNITAPKGGWQAAPASGGPPAASGNAAAGALQPQKPSATPPPAKFSPVARQDMADLQVFIHDFSLASGKMPPPATVFQALVAAKSPAAELVKDGSIMLTGATQRDGVWAYETRAIFEGGFAVSQNGVETLTAAQLKARLGK